jgi:hypothetical protein
MTDLGRELPRLKAIQIKLGWEFGMRHFTVSSAWFPRQNSYGEKSRMSV